MLATVLWSAAGKPAVTSAGFSDVAPDAWYASAVAWAQSVGVAAGYADGTFHPSDSVTREQLALMLYKYESLKSGAPAKSGDLSAYTDAGSVSSWAADAVSWCVSKGYISGMSCTFRPYPLVGSLTKTWVTAPTSLPFCTIGEPDIP